jgi:cell volume regulation protein A
MWGGLKGAVPILLGTFALVEGIGDGSRIYGIVFVVVAFSVVVQGTSIPFVAPRLGVRMRIAEPHSIQRCRVEPGSRAAGESLRDLPIGERTWIDRVVRREAPLRVRDGLVLDPGDEVWFITDVEDAARLERIFRAPRSS